MAKCKLFIGRKFIMYIVFLVLLLAFSLVDLITEVMKKNKPKGTVRTEKKQKNKYNKILAWMWGPAAVVVIMSFISGISFADLGFRAIELNHNLWFNAIILVINGLVLIYSWYPLILSLVSRKFREKMKADLAALGDGTRDILPHTKKEKQMYVLVSFSSGICEELVYRGFMLFLLSAVFPGMSIFTFILISGVLFGIGHIYQGWQGIIEAGLIGAFYMSLLIVTNSLILVMILHFISNVSGAFLLSEEGVV
jgi:membrane protease YdiL (CAAX protease family)